jgi:hypothetical protein
MRSDLLTKLTAVYVELARDTLKRMQQGGQAAVESPPVEPSRRGAELQDLFAPLEPGFFEAQAARLASELDQIQDALCGEGAIPTEGFPIGMATVKIAPRSAAAPAPRVPRRVTISDAEGIVLEMTDENEVVLHCAGRPNRVQDSLGLLAETMAMATKIGVPRDPLRTWYVLGTGAATPPASPAKTVEGDTRQTWSAPIVPPLSPEEQKSFDQVAEQNMRNIQEWLAKRDLPV